MSLLLYYLSLIIAVILESLFFLAAGIPLLLMVLKRLDIKGVISMAKKKRVAFSVATNLLLAVLVGGYILLDPYLNDTAFDHAMKSSGLSIPMYYASDVKYPEDKNDADDFGVDRTLKLIGKLSGKNVDKLNELVASDARWTMKGEVFHFEEYQFENETRMVVDIDLSGNTVRTSYLRW